MEQGAGVQEQEDRPYIIVPKQKRIRTQVRAALKARRPPGKTSTKEIATSLFRLVTPVRVFSGWRTIRPRSATALSDREFWTCPVNMDRPNERVKADVLVGDDGRAQAIRFVYNRGKDIELRSEKKL